MGKQPTVTSTTHTTRSHTHARSLSPLPVVAVALAFVCRLTLQPAAHSTSIIVLRPPCYRADCGMLWFVQGVVDRFVVVCRFDEGHLDGSGWFLCL